jgi:hypothetical protein
LSVGSTRIEAQVSSSPEGLVPGRTVMAAFDPANAAVYEDPGTPVPVEDEPLLSTSQA